VVGTEVEAGFFAGDLEAEDVLEETVEVLTAVFGTAFGTVFGGAFGIVFGVAFGTVFEAAFGTVFGAAFAEARVEEEGFLTGAF
jgi:hypothetical protein